MKAVFLALATVAVGAMSSALAQTSMPVRPGDTFRDCADCPAMVVIPAGGFSMGSPANEPVRDGDEGPRQRVAIERDFAVGRFEVTRGQYAAFMRASDRADGGGCYTGPDANGRYAPSLNATWRDPGFPQDDNHPVVCISWEDSQAYIQWLNTQTSGGYRLLSEAEWEYAARARTTSAFTWGSEPDAGCAFANGADVSVRGSIPSLSPMSMSCNDGAIYTAAVGSYQPSPFGLYDMVGNVSEWVQDCYQNNLRGVPHDGSAREVADLCESRVLRGPSWGSLAPFMRTAMRYGYSPTDRVSYLGFRVAKTIA